MFYIVHGNSASVALSTGFANSPLHILKYFCILESITKILILYVYVQKTRLKVTTEGQTSLTKPIDIFQHPVSANNFYDTSVILSNFIIIYTDDIGNLSTVNLHRSWTTDRCSWHWLDIKIYRRLVIYLPPSVGSYRPVQLLYCVFEGHKIWNDQWVSEGLSHQYYVILYTSEKKN